MAVDRKHRAGFQGIKDALAVVVRGVAKVVVLAETWGGFGLGGEGVKKGGVEFHCENYI